MTRVLLTGASGMLGCTLGITLESKGYTVIRHGREDGDLTGDLTSRDVTASIVASAKADFIVNLAALTNVDYCEKNPNAAYAQNTRIVENIAYGITSLGLAIHLIQVSTDQVYDGVGPHFEDDVRLTNYYGFSKYAGELAAQGVTSTVLRTNFFGRSLCAARSSISDWLVAGLTRGDQLLVFQDVWFNPLSLERLSEYIALLVERRAVGVFNLGSREGMTKADFCFAIARVLNLPTTTMSRGSSDDRGLFAYRPKDMRMNCSRFEGQFGTRLPSLAQEIESLARVYHVKR